MINASLEQTPRSEKVKINNLDFYYGETRALKSISLTLDEKKVTAFIGPSAANLLCCACSIGCMTSTRTSARPVRSFFDGANILSPQRDLNLLRARIGMVFQKPTPFPMSIYENIAFGIWLYDRLPKSELDGRVETSLRRAALWDEVKDKLSANGQTLSGGQQQRLCIARTVAVRPEVILLDEPCSALDPISTAKIEELINELIDEHAASSPSIGVHRVHVPRRTDRVRHDEQGIYHAARSAHAGLYYRPLRVTARPSTPGRPS